MTKHYLKHFHTLAAALVFGLMLGACGSDDDAAGGINSDNANANNTSKSIHATRIEVPRLQPGNNYQLLVKMDSEIGVNYIVEWDRYKKAQRWTCFHWTNENSKKNWDRKNWSNGATFNGYGGNYDPFQPDPELAQGERSELSDYSGSGYSRGHICASEDRIYSQNVNGQTFYLSNMHPQLAGHNTGVWQSMESKLRTWRDAVIAIDKNTKKSGEMFVVKGGTINDVTLNGQIVSGVKETVGANRIPVPKYFFMAILKKTRDGVYSALALWTEHKTDNSSNLRPYMISIDELEARTGYDFFCNLPDKVENAVESMFIENDWK